ncbi:class I SAM-dependent methyltransferase [Tunicatimonas pelagia]|uniref:class I SAM-dependent methyltransferase n=1 Tax=Tunicatimonas pelagia TaxID=931531 RepID=UPI002666317B|nr:class I SAM-dependent methyltransferase [Tunicatimonas pelagia]WKN40712.1 class I SAM-dependent methyltransferase [Tunicatimonas pelagia]
MKKIIKKSFLRFPYIKKLYQDLQTYKTWKPPGHYYSPIPDIDYVDKNYSRITKRLENYAGLELRNESQKDLLISMSRFYSDIPYQEEKQPDYRYYFNNSFFCYGDAILLYCMLRHVQPNQIIEVGSGFSSSIMLDVNQHYLSRSMKLTFIEPYPERLNTLLKPEDTSQSCIKKGFVQDVEVDFFRNLERGDILFIDSSHVSKAGSDLNYFLFQVLPILQDGVIVHFHDIFHNFEYPLEWIKQGRAWNESYLLRAFLQYNDAFHILLFNAYQGKYESQWMNQHMPLFMKNPGGSIWLQVHKS